MSDLSCQAILCYGPDEPSPRLTETFIEGFKEELVIAGAVRETITLSGPFYQPLDPRTGLGDFWGVGLRGATVPQPPSS